MATSSSTKNQARRQAKLEREYREKERFLVEIGARAGKAETLTRKIKSNINDLYSKYRQYSTDKYFVIRPTENKREILGRASALEMVTTPRAIIVEKEGYKRARFVKQKGEDKFGVSYTGYYKSGELTGKRKKKIVPLAPIGALDKERERLIKAARQLGPMGKNDRLMFKIIDSHTSYSKFIFQTVDKLIEKLMEYERKNVGERIKLFRAVEIEKTTREEYLDRKQLQREAKAEKARRRRRGARTERGH